MSLEESQPAGRYTALLDGGDSYRIITSLSEYLVNKRTGLITSIIGGGKEMLASPVTPIIWRAPIDNDRRIKVEWYNACFDRAFCDCRGTEITRFDDRGVGIRASLVIGANGLRPFAFCDADYLFLPDGGVTVALKVRVREGLPPLPRFGLAFNMPEGNEQLRYYGRGTAESYEDKRYASRVGLYRVAVKDNFEHYVRPQENMSHADTLWASVTDLSGNGLLLTSPGRRFPFTAQHYTPKQLTETRHDFELVPMKETFVAVDYRQTATGSASCGPALPERLRLSETEFGMTLRLLPVNINDCDAFAEARKK
ncbi:MAG: hypothetical protein J6V01_03660 [Clostridia bacterium]|nr:hypothetical protein [Clostridia bacterium]